MTSARGSARPWGAAFLVLVLAAAFAVSARGRTTAGTRSWSLAAAGYSRVVVLPGRAAASSRSAALAAQGGNAGRAATLALSAS